MLSRDEAFKNCKKESTIDTVKQIELQTGLTLYPQ